MPRSAELFPECERPPRRKPRKLMHVYDAGDSGCYQEDDELFLVLQCLHCLHVTDWLLVTKAELRAGIPCPNCNADK